jgi:hypothetical protein
VTIEGVLEAETLRDFLYTKMRGVRDGGSTARATPAAAPHAAMPADAGDEALALLTDIRDALRRLEARSATPPGGGA